MSKLQGVKNALTWLHMVRLTQSSTKFCCDFSKNFEVQKCAWNRIILHRVHALLRDPLRGGRDHFTERKIDQIRGRLGKFGDLLTEIMRFQGFWWVVFYLVFKICWNFNFLKEFGLIMFVLSYFLKDFEGSKLAILGKIAGRAYVVDPGIEHEPRRFFDAFWREIKTEKFQDLSFRTKTNHF